MEPTASVWCLEKQDLHLTDAYVEALVFQLYSYEAQDFIGSVTVSIDDLIKHELSSDKSYECKAQLNYQLANIQTDGWMQGQSQDVDSAPKIDCKIKLCARIDMALGEESDIYWSNRVSACRQELIE